MERKTHPRGRAYQCLHCMRKGKEEVNTKTRMEDHIYKYHIPNDEQPFWCRLCHFRSRSKESLLMHVRTFVRHRNVMKEKGYIDSEPFLVCNPKPYLLSEKDLKMLDKEESSSLWSRRTGDSKPLDLIEKALEMEVPEVYYAAKYIQDVEAEEIEDGRDVNGEQKLDKRDISNDDKGVGNGDKCVGEVPKVANTITVDEMEAGTIDGEKDVAVEKAQKVNLENGKSKDKEALDSRTVVGGQKAWCDGEGTGSSEVRSKREVNNEGALDMRIVKSVEKRTVVTYEEYKKRQVVKEEQTAPVDLSMRRGEIEKREVKQGHEEEGANDDRRENIVMEEKVEKEGEVGAESDTDSGATRQGLAEPVAGQGQTGEVGLEAEMAVGANAKKDHDTEVEIATRMLVKTMEEARSKERDSEGQDGRTEIDDGVGNTDDGGVAGKGGETGLESAVRMSSDEEERVDGSTDKEVAAPRISKRMIKERDVRARKRVRQSLKKYRTVSASSSSDLSDSDSSSSSSSGNSDSDNSRERFTEILGEMIRKTGSIVGEQVIVNAGLIKTLQRSVDELRKEVKSLRQEIKANNVEKERGKKERDGNDKKDKESKEGKRQAYKRGDDRSDKENKRQADKHEDGRHDKESKEVRKRAYNQGDDRSDKEGKRQADKQEDGRHDKESKEVRKRAYNQGDDRSDKEGKRQADKQEDGRHDKESKEVRKRAYNQGDDRSDKEGKRQADKQEDGRHDKKSKDVRKRAYTQGDDRSDKESKEARRHACKQGDDRQDKESEEVKKQSLEEKTDNRAEARRDRGADERGPAQRRKMIGSNTGRGYDRYRQRYQSHRGRNSYRGRGREFVKF